MAKKKVQNTGGCKVDGCDRPAKSMNMCNTHYMQYRRGARNADGVLLRSMRGAAKGIICKIEGCAREVIGKGYCTKHYQQYQHGHRDIDGNLLDGVRERNAGPKSMSVEKRIKSGFRAGSCILCENQMFHGGTGFCSKHYAQFNRGQINEVGEAIRAPYRVASYKGVQCKVEDCTSEARSLGMCTYHYDQIRSGHRTPDGVSIKEPKHGGPRNGKNEWAAGRNYRKVRCPDHPNADQYGFVYKHHLPVEERLGRPINTKYELVHHKRGTVAGDGIENLELRLRRDHPPGHEYDLSTSAQVILQDDSVPEKLKKELKKFLKKLN